jgi:hypothetical protein
MEKGEGTGLKKRPRGRIHTAFTICLRDGSTIANESIGIAIGVELLLAFKGRSSNCALENVTLAHLTLFLPRQR